MFDLQILVNVTDVYQYLLRWGSLKACDVNGLRIIFLVLVHGYGFDGNIG